MYDTVIIGAGMSGLAAGIRLAHFERRVCILERHSAIGGLNSFYGRKGRNFDVGLHAITNYMPKGTRQGPLARLLRQLRLAWEELSLTPQVGSAIMFPGLTLEFSNDFSLFESEVIRHFPRQKDNFQRLMAALADYDAFARPENARSAREVVSGFIDDPLLVEMLFCPILFYGSAREHDMDFGQFSILFRSIFFEGLARPLAGVRLLLRRLVRKFLERGGELRLRAGVSRIVVKGGKAERVVLEDGTELETHNILSSAGWPETIRLCDDCRTPAQRPAGGLSIVECISILNAQPAALGHQRTIVFYNDSEKFHYHRPTEPADPRSGIVCSPNNFSYDEPLSDNIIRVSALANYDRWAGLDAAEYQSQKRQWYDRVMDSAARFVPDFRPAVIEADMFTPVTIRRFTGHENGAIYGAAEKRYDGTTHLENLYVCGNDQGLVGIIGAILSGIGVVNRYLLKT
jgi:phytoene dehydrogenase-like protein